ncbi:MAG: 50S ribosomal protein L6 [Bacteriovoracaceae bacterium]|nr:50S ribosomal protein L6 [Bacteriovoracaceae bacterium]
MSRIGKKPIALPEKVEVKIAGNSVEIKGPKGTLSYVVNDGVKVEKKDKAIEVVGSTDRVGRSLWGLTRTIVSNMVTGVSSGFKKELEFTGVGYKAAVTGQTLQLNLGYSHQIDYKLPKGIAVTVNKNVIEVNGSDKELVGFVAAQIRAYRPHEPYKGKGLKYVGEKVIRKAGKTGAKK